MVRDAHDAVTDETDTAPQMLRQPADAPPPLPHIGTSASVLSFRRIRAARQHGPARTPRGWASRISGRSDRRLLLALAEATEAMAMHMDLLIDRLASQEAVTSDVADAFGRDLALLRAEVARVRRSLEPPKDARS
jgi:hypothetical protein